MGAPGRLLGLRRAAARLAGGLPEEASGEPDLERRLRSQAKAAREHRIQRLMEPPRPPERTLTRRAMEQIRYLGREWPEEWPVARLARGFQVSPDIVCRVLRSRFVPSPPRAAKQDASAAASAGLQGPLGERPRAALRLLPASEQSRAAAGRRKLEQGRRGSPVEAEASERPLRRPAELVAEEARRSGERRPLTLVPVQRGREFFDQDGNLLYRIPEGSASPAAAPGGGVGGQKERQD